jgi:hypothetical protein
MRRTTVRLLLSLSLAVCAHQYDASSRADSGERDTLPRVIEHGWMAALDGERVAVRRIDERHWHFILLSPSRVGGSQRAPFDSAQLRLDKDGAVWLARWSSRDHDLELARAEAGADQFQHVVSVESTARSYALAPGGWLYFVHGGRLDDHPIRYYSPRTGRVEEMEVPPDGDDLSIVGGVAIASRGGARYRLDEGRALQIGKRK